MREVIFDTETTGLDPKTGDRMVEIGCVEMVGRVETGRTFHAYFNPDRDMPPEAERVHGLSAAFLASKPRFAETAEELLEFLGDSNLVAHNAGFDFGFLNNELELIGRAPISYDRMVDTVAIARKRHPGAKLSLDALCTRYGIDRSHRVGHGALLDAELLAQVYVELTGGRQIGLGLADDAPAVAPASGQLTPMRPGTVPQRTSPGANPACMLPARRSLERHAAFIAQIKGAIWVS